MGEEGISAWLDLRVCILGFTGMHDDKMTKLSSGKEQHFDCFLGHQGYSSSTYTERKM